MGVYSTVLWSTVMFVVSSVAGFTSFRVRHRYQQAMIYLNAASTGVILAAAFTHLLPDAIEDLSQFSYPVGPAMALTGFLLMVLVETGLHSRNLETEHRNAAREHEKHDSTEHEKNSGGGAVHNVLVGVPSSSFVKVKDQADGGHQCCATLETLERECSNNAKKRHTLASENMRNMTEADIELSPLLHEMDNGDADIESTGLLSSSERSHSPSHSHSHDHSHSHSHNHSHTNMTSSTSSSSIVSGSSSDSKKSTTTHAATTSLWLALVVHSMMEGFGIGVTKSPLKQTTLVLAILIHKGFASLALASALLESGMEHKLFLSFFLTFSLASPLGAMVACLASLEGGSAVLSGVVTGLASGSFMYIGFMEMLPAMLTSCQHMTDAMLLFVLSAAAMAALAAVV